MGALKGWHIVVLLVVVLLLFGAPKLPELARSVGKSLHILKDEAKSLTSDDEPNGTTASGTRSGSAQSRNDAANASTTEVDDKHGAGHGDPEARGN